MSNMVTVYLEITLKSNAADRNVVLSLYHKFKSPFLDQIKGAVSIELLISDEDFQLLHSFETLDDAQAYLSTELYNNDILVALKPLLLDNPVVKIYSVA